MNNNNASSRSLPNTEERQVAEQKLCHLFRSFGVDAAAERERLIDTFLDQAANFWRPQAGYDLGKLAVEEAETALESWFTALLEDRFGELDSAVMVGRAAFLMCDGPDSWSDQLLQPLETLPAAFVKALRDSAPSAVPPSDMGEMHHQPYEAWSPTAAFASAIPVERAQFPTLQGLFRRETGGSLLNWRSTDPTS
jgi:hypothetical protein